MRIRKIAKMPLTPLLLSFLVLLLSGCMWQEIDRTPVENVGQSFRIRVAHGGSEAMLTHRALEVFREEVENNSNGQISVQIFPSGQLGNEATVISSLQTDDIEMTVVNTAAMVPFASFLNVLAVPFVFPSHDIAFSVLDGDFGQQISYMFEEEMGVVGLGFWDSLDFRQLTSNRPIQTPDDLSGLRIRTMENPIQIAIWNSLGASPTPISFAELYTSLQQGIVDAQENPLELITMMRFYEVQEYVTLTNHLFQTSQAVVSARFYHSLPPDLQQVVREAVRTSIEFQREVFSQDYERFMDLLLYNNIEVIALTDEERAMFIEGANEVVDAIRNQVGSELVDSLHLAVEAAVGQTRQ
ncbi:MAG: TRAP transporter substrate-binding protein [Defluviitaleaceae bacterium]|nr:TRAP transporter substrate-binding protein [Defluviitaleaceae bacterium]